CFPLAAALHASPQEIAARLARTVTLGPLLESAQASGGYLNLTFARGAFAAGVMGDVHRMGDRYGALDAGGGRTVVIDFSAPNVARQMSVGHLRSTIIGAALYELHKFAGYQSIGDNHLGDWGTQFGTLLYAYHAWLDREAYAQDPIGELLRLYVKFDAEARRDPSLRDQARQWHLRQDQGALIVRLDDVGIKTPLILRRSDGATLYHTRDLATAIYRLRTFHPSKILYVVGADQRLHFQQLFATLRKLGFGDVDYVHVDFGLIQLPQGRMSTRRGRVVFLEDVLDEAMARARRLVEEKNPELSEPEKDEVARIVGIGAIKYADLSQNRVKNIVFDWD